MRPCRIDCFPDPPAGGQNVRYLPGPVALPDGNRAGSSWSTYTAEFSFKFFQEHASCLIGHASIRRNHLHISPFFKLLSRAVYARQWDDILDLDCHCVPMDPTRPMEHCWNPWWKGDFVDENGTMLEDIQRYHNQVRDLINPIALSSISIDLP